MVYVVQDRQGINLLPATEYGELSVLLPEENQIVLSCAAIVDNLKEKLSNFSDNDYLLLVGDPAAIGVCTAIAAAMNNGYVNMLKWDRQTKRYYPILIDISERKGDVTK